MKRGSQNSLFSYILKATFPFFLIMIFIVVVVTAFPEIATYLPQHMIGK